MLKSIVLTTTSLAATKNFQRLQTEDNCGKTLRSNVSIINENNRAKEGVTLEYKVVTLLTLMNNNNIS